MWPTTVVTNDATTVLTGYGAGFRPPHIMESCYVTSRTCDRSRSVLSRHATACASAAKAWLARVDKDEVFRRGDHPVHKSSPSTFADFHKDSAMWRRYCACQ